MDNTMRSQKCLQPLRKTHVGNQMDLLRLCKKGQKIRLALVNGLKCVTNVLTSEFKYYGTVSLVARAIEATPHNGRFKKLQALRLASLTNSQITKP